MIIADGIYKVLHTKEELDRILDRLRANSGVRAYDPVVTKENGYWHCKLLVYGSPYWKKGRWSIPSRRSGPHYREIDCTFRTEDQALYVTSEVLKGKTFDEILLGVVLAFFASGALVMAFIVCGKTWVESVANTYTSLVWAVVAVLSCLVVVGMFYGILKEAIPAVAWLEKETIRKCDEIFGPGIYCNDAGVQLLDLEAINSGSMNPKYYKNHYQSGICGGYGNTYSFPYVIVREGKHQFSAHYITTKEAKKWCDAWNDMLNGKQRMDRVISQEFLLQAKKRPVLWDQDNYKTKVITYTQARGEYYGYCLENLKQIALQNMASQEVQTIINQLLRQWKDMKVADFCRQCDGTLSTVLQNKEWLGVEGKAYYDECYAFSYFMLMLDRVKKGRSE